jgi:Toprim domain
VLADWQAGVVQPRAADEYTLKLALELWETAKPIAGTPAIEYLAGVRGIDVDALPPEAPLRFHQHCVFGPGLRLPCLLALYRDVESDAPAGIHRVALTPEVLAGGKVERRTLGSWPAPRAIKLWPASDPQLFIGEGLETSLAAATRLQYRGAPMRPAWAAGSRTGLSKLPVLSGIERLVVLVDHDINGQGQAAAARCAERWSRAGRTVARLTPRRAGADFNDIVKEKAA